MKKSVLIKFGCLAGLVAGSVAQGQVFSVHDIQHGYAFYTGYNVMAFGQGALSDPGNNIWNGFGNGGGPGSTDSFGGGRPNDALLPNNPGNPYAWSHVPFFAQGPNLFAPTSEGAPNAGNATSAGVHSPVTVPKMVYGFDSGSALSSGTLRTNVAEWIYSEAAVVNGASPGAGTAANPLGSMILSNVSSGTYDLFLYGANYDGTRGATFAVDSGTPTNGVYVTENPYEVAGSGPETNFVLGVDYVVFNNVTPNADSTIHITWGAVSNINSGFAGEGDFNGLQLIPGAPVNAGPIILVPPAPGPRFVRIFGRFPSAMKLSEIARALDARLVGDGSIEIDRPVNPVDAESPRDLALAMEPETIALLKGGPARAALIREEKELPEGTLRAISWSAARATPWRSSSSSSPARPIRSPASIRPRWLGR